jgi:hypothetical protein
VADCLLLKKKRRAGVFSRGVDRVLGLIVDISYRLVSVNGLK